MNQDYIKAQFCRQKYHDYSSSINEKATLPAKNNLNQVYS